MGGVSPQQLPFLGLFHLMQLSLNRRTDFLQEL
jgi:hypothetical protein